MVICWIICVLWPGLCPSPVMGSCEAEANHELVLTWAATSWEPTSPCVVALWGSAGGCGLGWSLEFGGMWSAGGRWGSWGEVRWQRASPPAQSRLARKWEHVISQTIPKLFCGIPSCTFLESRKLKFRKSGWLAKVRCGAWLTYSPSKSVFPHVRSGLCCILQWLKSFIGYRVTSLGIISSSSSFTKICSDIPREYIILWLIFCFVLFSLFVNFHCSIMLICVLCLFWLSFLTSPFEFFSLFSSPPILQISLDQTNICFANPIFGSTHVKASLWMYESVSVSCEKCIVRTASRVSHASLLSLIWSKVHITPLF